MTSTTTSTVPDDRELSEEQAWALLASDVFGRLRLHDSLLTESESVSYTVDDRSLVFRTRNGSALQQLFDDTWIEFEATTDSPSTETWTVRARGRTEIMDHSAHDADYVRLHPNLIRARYFRSAV